MYKEKAEGNKNFTKLAHKGVSLIVLIITIIVIIILASVIILTISKNNPIESAKEAQFKEDIRTFQYELNLYISKEYAVTGGKRDKKIDALDFEKIKEYIPSFSEKYREKFVIQDDELRYTEKIVETEKEWLKELNTKEREYLLPEGYTELEYIESTGTQYIDTGVETTSGYRIKTNISISQWGKHDSEAYFAGFLSNIIYRDYTVFYQQKPMIGMNTDVQASIIITLNTWYSIDASTISENGFFKLNDDILLTSSNTVLHDNYNIYIFGVNYYNQRLFLELFCKNESN